MSHHVPVRDLSGKGLFDTNDCYDYGNAVNALDLWLKEQSVQPGESMAHEEPAASEYGVSEVPNDVRRNGTRLVVEPWA